jgi:hypothetical protein
MTSFEGVIVAKFTPQTMMSLNIAATFRIFQPT